MFFRYSSSIYPDGLHVDSSFKDFEFSLDESMVIRICGSNGNKIKSKSCEHDPFCQIVHWMNLDRENKEILDALEEGSIESGQEPWGSYQIFKTRSGKELRIVNSSGFPEEFKSFILSTQSLFGKTVKNVVSILRWRMGLPGSSRIIRFSKLEWSNDRSKWNYFNYGLIPPILEIEKLPDESKIAKDEMHALAANVLREPVHHELFREAWEMRLNHPRSAIVIGISAAEVAMKECIGELIPNSRWLVEESPSPPLVAMIKNYLPLLPAKNTFNDEVLPPPKSIRRDIEEGVKLRNKVVHIGRQTPSNRRLKEILLSVKDFLWLIDYYCGHAWSLSYVRDETLVEMGLKKNSRVAIPIAKSKLP